MPYIVVIQWRDGEREDSSDHWTLQGAAKHAFELAERLSLLDCPRHAAEVAVLQDGKLQISIAISPGEPLTKAV